jgi:hypothetical protein
MPPSEVSTTFQDSYFKGDYHKCHEAIRAIGPGKLWGKDLLDILKKCGESRTNSGDPKDYASWLHDLFLANEETLKRIEPKYDKIKLGINQQGLGDDFFLVLALGTLKEMQHRGYFPNIIIKDGEARAGPIV